MFDINKHRAVMLQLLKDIYSDTNLSSLLGFKGGTACFLFYDLPRFSVDLDFDLLDPEKESRVFKKVGKIAESYGKIKDKTNKRFTLFFLLSYKDGAKNIKIEISKRPTPASYETKNYLGVPMLVMEKEDMFASKLVALTQRRSVANRDLFDVWFFMKNRWSINEEIIKKRTGKDLAGYLKDCIAFVDVVEEKHILQGLGELVGERKKMNIKKNLKKDLLFLMKIYLEEVGKHNG